MTRRDFWKYLTRVHKWAGLILGVQILIWFFSGFFMSFFDIETVRGNHVAKPKNWALSIENTLPIAQVANGYSGTLEETKLISVMGEPAYVLKGDKGPQYINAMTGEAWLPLGETSIRIAADMYYKGQGDIKSVAKLKMAPIEYRKSLPVWQVEYADRTKTRLYIHPETGDLVNVRTRLWRVFDFMWMLHIMDYKGRDNINNWWLWLAALMASLFAISGLSLIVHRVFLRPKTAQAN